MPEHSYACILEYLNSCILEYSCNSLLEYFFSFLDRKVLTLSRTVLSISVLSFYSLGLALLQGQFSSSPIQERGRAYSLGNVTSPMFPEQLSPLFKSPTLSPIVLQHSVTPQSGRVSHQICVADISRKDYGGDGHVCV